MKKLMTLICLLFSASIGFSQVGIGTKNPDATSVLDLSSSTKGLLIPRMTTAQRADITNPSIGLTVFDLEKMTYWYYTDTAWVEMTINKEEWINEENNSRTNEDWDTQGNSISEGAFLGTTNNQPLVIKTNGSERMRVAGTGNVGIGTTMPHAPLQFANDTRNRKVVLYEPANNDNQFYGFGVDDGALRYQVPGKTKSHVFYAGASPTTSPELMRIEGNGDVVIAGTIENETYAGPELGDGYSDYGNGNAPGGFYKDKEGRVHLRGSLRRESNAGSLIMTLPEGYRPAFKQFFTGWSGSSSDPYSIIVVAPNGEVHIMQYPGPFITIDMISFRAEQ